MFRFSECEKGLFCRKPTLETKPASPPIIANPADYEASPWPVVTRERRDFYATFTRSRFGVGRRLRCLKAGKAASERLQSSAVIVKVLL